MTVVTLTVADSSPWTVPAGVSSISVETLGGGSGGNGGRYLSSYYYYGGLGGNATTIQTTVIACTPSQTFAFSIGIGGTAGLGDHNPGYPNNGGTGGDTTFAGATISYGATRSAGVNTVNQSNGDPGTNGAIAGGPGASAGGGTYGGAGGTGYGAGGGGGDGHNDGSGDGYDGGAGAAGCIRITYTAAVTPVASFTHGSEGVAPTTIAFTDTSTNTPTSWLWTWDDGTASSTAQNPSHTFNTADTFTVTLVATNAAGSDDYFHDIVITAAPDAKFVANPPGIHNGIYSAKVRFYNRSTGTTTKITSFNWFFEASRTFTTNFAASTSQLLLANAVAYFAVGNRVTLTSSGSPMDLPDGLLPTVCYYVKAVTSTYLTVSLTSGGAAVTFSDDGTGTHKVGIGSVDENPVHTYPDVAGTKAYNVTLTVIDAGLVPATQTKTWYIYHRLALP